MRAARRGLHPGREPHPDHLGSRGYQGHHDGWRFSTKYSVSSVHTPAPLERSHSSSISASDGTPLPPIHLTFAGVGSPVRINSQFPGGIVTVTARLEQFRKLQIA